MTLTSFRPFLKPPGQGQAAQQFEPIGRQSAAIGEDRQAGAEATTVEGLQRAAEILEIAETNRKMRIVTDSEPADIEPAGGAGAFHLDVDHPAEAALVEGIKGVVHHVRGQVWPQSPQCVQHQWRGTERKGEKMCDVAQPFTDVNKTAVATLRIIVVEEVGAEMDTARPEFRCQDEGACIMAFAEQIDAGQLLRLRLHRVDDAHLKCVALGFQNGADALVSDAYTGGDEMVLARHKNTYAHQRISLTMATAARMALHCAGAMAARPGGSLRSLLGWGRSEAARTTEVQRWR